MEVIPTDHLRRRTSTVTAILILALVYAVAGRAGQIAAIPPGYVTAIWPSSGIALAAVLLQGKRIWPGIWLGSFVLNNWVYVRYTHSSPSAVSVGAAALIGAGASVAALAGAYLLRRIAGSEDLFSRTGDVVWFAAIGVFGSCLISATTGASSLLVMGLIGRGDYFQTWWTWWLGDAAGVLVVTPLLLTWSKTRVRFERWRAIEAVALLVLLIAASAVAFGNDRYPLAYIVLPVLIAAALRFRQLGATAGIALVSFIGTFYTAHGRGPFSAKTWGINESLLLLGSFMVLTGFTILILAAVWSEREQEILEVVHERDHATSAELQAEHSRLYAAQVMAEGQRKTKELQEATELQLSMLPASLPEMPGFDIAAHMQSASEVGGDYYNILPRRMADETRSYLLCVADVSGKGLVASLLMSNFQAMLLTLADQPLPLAEVASRLGALLRPRSRYITSIMMQLDVVTGIGRYVSAGHTSGIVIRADGDLEWLFSNGFPLGMFADVIYNEETFHFRSGDVLALLSDGFTDALDNNEQEFGEARLVDYLCQVRCTPADEIVAGAFKEVSRFIGSAPQFDDITLVVVKRTNPSSNPLLDKSS